MAVAIDWFTGERAPLRFLFQLAEDSAIRLDEYIELGQVLVAHDGPDVIGHLQLVPTAHAGAIELKNMAVVADRQGTGLGARSSPRPSTGAPQRDGAELLVATAAADIGNLRFYQRAGFRLLAVERDAFTAATGYPDPIVVDGIPLLDRVWLSRAL